MILQFYKARISFPGSFHEQQMYSQHMTWTEQAHGSLLYIVYHQPLDQTKQLIHSY